MNRAFFFHNDFIQPLGTWDFRVISSAPKPTKNYLTLFNPFDRYIWACLIASVVAVSFALIFIDMVYATWSNVSKRGILIKGN